MLSLLCAGKFFLKRKNMKNLNVFKKLFWVCIVSTCFLGLNPMNAHAKASMGINPGELPSILVDVFKASRYLWEADAHNWDTGGILNLRPDGYPATLQPGKYARTMFLEDPSDPAGTYTLLYDGEGTIMLDNDASNIVHTDNGGIDNKITFTSTSGEMVILDITATNYANPVRNIRVIRPDLPGTDFLSTYKQFPFVPLFYERMKNFSVIRFMDWCGTNWSPLVNWTERATLDSQTWAIGQGVKGLPYEIMIDLCNYLQIDGWFCLPHRATDHYVTQFATLLRDNFDPYLHAYIEYSNEIWNGLFSHNANANGQFSYAWEQAALHGWPSYEQDYFQGNGRWVAQRSVEIFDLFKSVFGDFSRIKRVLAIQNGPDLTTPWILDHVVNGQPAYMQADVVAGAPYFGDGSQDIPGIETWTVDQLLDWVEAGMFGQDSALYWAGQTINLLNSPPYNSAHLTYVCYEAGQHMWNFTSTGMDDPLTVLQHAANRHPRMHGLYTQYMDAWDAMGGGVMCHFFLVGTPSPYGFFGLLESIDIDISLAPKWMAVDQWIKHHQPSEAVPAAGLPVLITTGLFLLGIGAGGFFLTGKRK
jgi:hypothetical protein